MKENHFEMVAKTLYGLEDILAGELTALGADDVETGRRMVSFSGDKAMLYKANFHCRTALRILKPIAHFKADHADVVYREIKNMDWDDYLSPDKTFAIDAVVYSEKFNHSKFVAYRTKDAIADYFNDKYGKRPSVRVNNPDVYINIHISHNDCTVSLDSSGESLHKRGYRVAQVEAPLNEVLAAGMILRTDWRGETNFIDPMCGSGTLLIEAAMIALNIAPGVFRKEYAFERWPDFDRELLDEIYNDESSEREFDFKCYGSDISPIAIEKAMKNIRSAGLSKYIEIKSMPFQQYTEAVRPGILVMNPPYGERISSGDIMELYSMIGERLKHVFSGYEAWILSYKDECFDKIGLRPKHKIKLINGDLDCEYRCYELFEGKKTDYKKAIREHGGRLPERTLNKTDFSARKPGGIEHRDRVERFGREGERRRSFGSDEKFGERQKKSGERQGKFYEERTRTDSRINKKFAEERLAAKDRKRLENNTPSSSGKSRSSDWKDKPFVRGRESSGRNPESSGGSRGSFGKGSDRFDKDRKPARDRKVLGKDDKFFGKKDKPYDRNSKSFKNKPYED
ncbi:MAG: THUMP domain-containing protein [Tannerella sp.]|jgi:putative N6-adenine-specific DNA methylase|nr:THUMP domain-containing protein [Tannerella sp.]